MTTAYAQAVYLKSRQQESYRAAVEQARLNAQLRKVEKDNEDFSKVVGVLLFAKARCDEREFPFTASAIDEAIDILRKRILHVVGEREARELSTDGRL